MSIQLHILKASERLLPFVSQIENAFNASIEKIQHKISLPAVDVIVADNASSAIPETGVGGYASTAHLVYINIDPQFKDLSIVLDAEIQSTLAHELHHCARMDSVGYGKILFEQIISEGLADHFDMEINGGDPKPWSVAIHGAELDGLLKKAESEFDHECNHSDWFFGTNTKVIPRWAGYSLGYKIVGDYIQKTGKKASELVNAEAGIFRL